MTFWDGFDVSDTVLTAQYQFVKREAECISGTNTFKLDAYPERQVVQPLLSCAG